MASFHTGCNLDLRYIALNGVNVEYRREINRLAMLRKEPRGCAYIYSSGNIICVGSTSETNIRNLCRIVARSLQKMNFPVRFLNFKVVNVFSQYQVPFLIDLRLCYKHAKNLSFINELVYEPELHPALTIKINNLKIHFRIFLSGSVTHIGHSEESLMVGASLIYPLLYKSMLLRK
ncbi:hypothetical protein GJ496_003117 [Pomphorhynchus laevis]|nr:hypothetical protein GJ496_003117 [Pomphorhynchus laevis]